MTWPEPPLPESRFTAPSAFCPHPARWTSTDGDSTEREVAEMIFGLIRGLQPDAVLETGTGFGEVASFIADALHANGQGKLYTIEGQPDRAAFARERITWTELVEVIDGHTLEWEPPEGIVFDFCWFDAWYGNRVPEFLRYRPFMRAGTIVGFHDTAPGHGGDPNIPNSDIRSTIAAALRPQLRMIHLPTPRGVTLGEVLP